MTIRAQEQFLQGFQVRPRLLGRVVDRRFIAPHVQIEKKRLPGDKEIMIRQAVMIQHAVARPLHPVLVQVIRAVRPVTLARIHIVNLHPQIRVALGGARRLPLRARDQAFARKHTRAVAIDKQARDLQLRTGNNEPAVKTFRRRVIPNRQQVFCSRHSGSDITRRRNRRIIHNRPPNKPTEPFHQINYVIDGCDPASFEPTTPRGCLLHPVVVDILFAVLRIHKTHVQSRRIPIDQPLQGAYGVTMVPRHPELCGIVGVDIQCIAKIKDGYLCCGQ